MDWFKIISRYAHATVLPMQESFFYTQVLPKKLTLTSELLHFNYAKHAPIANPHIVATILEQQLLLWFTDKKVSSLMVPEAYLLYRVLKKIDTDALFVVFDKVYKIIIIKDSKLIGAYVSQTWSQTVAEQSKDAYGVARIKELSDSAMLIQKSKQSITPKELLYFLDINIQKSNLINVAVEKLSYPMALFVALFIGVNLVQGNYLEKKSDTLYKELQTKREQNSVVAEAIAQHNKEIAHYEAFITKELGLYEPMHFLEATYTTLLENESVKIVSFALSGNKLSLRLETDLNPIVFLNRIAKLDGVGSVVIENTFTPRNAQKQITYAIELLSKGV